MRTRTIYAVHIRRADGSQTIRKQVAHSVCHAIHRVTGQLIKEGNWHNVRTITAPEGEPQSGAKKAERKRRSEAQKARRKRELAEWDPFD